MPSIPIFVYWIIFFLFAIALFKFLFLDGQSGKEKFPYKKSSALFSPAERSFLGTLDLALGSDYRVFGKVRIADVVTVSGTVGKSAWQTAFNRICAKHFDYVVCESRTLQIVCVIELNDKSHSAHKRQLRDQFVNNLCKSIGLPLITIQASMGYVLPELRDKIKAAISPQVETATTVAPVRIEPTVNRDAPV